MNSWMRIFSAVSATERKTFRLAVANLIRKFVGNESNEEIVRASRSNRSVFLASEQLLGTDRKAVPGQQDLFCLLSGHTK
jgi:hypothetical protein